MDVKAVRLKHRWTQIQLAAYCGVSVATVQSWEQKQPGSEQPLRTPGKTNIDKIRALI